MLTKENMDNKLSQDEGYREGAAGKSTSHTSMRTRVQIFIMHMKLGMATNMCARDTPPNTLTHSGNTDRRIAKVC